MIFFFFTEFKRICLKTSFMRNLNMYPSFALNNFSINNKYLKMFIFWNGLFRLINSIDFKNPFLGSHSFNLRQPKKIVTVFGATLYCYLFINNNIIVYALLYNRLLYNLLKLIKDNANKI